MEKGFFKKNKILGINLLYILSVLPLIIFGFYKNGIVVYQHDFISLLLALQYLIIPIVIIILSYVFETYYYMGTKKEEDTNSVVNSIVPYVNVLCYLVCAPNDYLWLTIPLIIVLDVLLKFIDSKLAINQIALFKGILFGVMTLMNNLNYANLYEASLSSQVTDPAMLFIGNGIGAIGVTSSLCALIGYIILLFNSYYKKDIPIVAFIGYAIVSIIMYFVGGLSFNDILVNTFNSGLLFALIYVASLSTATPVIRSGRIIYALLVGVLCAISVNILNMDIGVYIVILVLGLLSPIFDKFKLSLGE